MNVNLEISPMLVSFSIPSRVRNRVYSFLSRSASVILLHCKLLLSYASSCIMRSMKSPQTMTHRFCCSVFAEYEPVLWSFEARHPENLVSKSTGATRREVTLAEPDFHRSKPLDRKPPRNKYCTVSFWVACEINNEISLNSFTITSQNNLGE